MIKYKKQSYGVKQMKLTEYAEKNNMKIDSLNTRSIEMGRRLMEADDND